MSAPPVPPAPPSAPPPSISGPPPADEVPAVRIRSLVKRFGSVTAVGGLDLTIAPGGIVGLIGPNGAGKTTTMRCIAGLIRPDAGHITVFGADPVRQPGLVRRRVGWMPDFFGVYDALTAKEYLDFFAAAYKVPKDQRAARVEELLDLVRLSQKRDTDVEGLSRGMQQRLALARALVHDPLLLLLDEPASGLDPRARVELREILLALAEQGTTVVLSSHILAELAEVCDRVVIVSNGGLQADGRMDELSAAAEGGVVQVRLRILPDEVDPRPTARRVLDAHAAQLTRAHRGEVEVRVTGGDDEVARIVSDLVAAGVRVAEVTQRRVGLEDLFLRLTNETVGVAAAVDDTASGGAR